MNLIVFAVFGAIALFLVWSLLKRIHVGSEIKDILEHASKEAKLAYEKAEGFYKKTVRPWAMGAGWGTIAFLALAFYTLFRKTGSAPGEVPFDEVLPCMIAVAVSLLIVGYTMARDNNHLSIFSLVSWSSLSLGVCGLLIHITGCINGSVVLAITGALLMIAGLGAAYLLLYLFGVGVKKAIVLAEGFIKGGWGILRILLLSTGQKGVADVIGNAPDIAPEEKILPAVNATFAGILFVFATYFVVDANWCYSVTPFLVTLVEFTAVLSLFLLGQVGIPVDELRKRGTRIVVGIALTGMVWTIVKTVFPLFLTGEPAKKAGAELIADAPSKIGSTALLIGQIGLAGLALIVVLVLGFLFIDFMESRTEGFVKWVCRMALAGIAGLLIYKIGLPAYQLADTDVVATVRAQQQGVQMAQAASAQPSAAPAPKPAPAPGPTTAQPARKVPANAVASKGHAHRGANMQEICKLTGECPQ